MNFRNKSNLPPAARSGYASHFLLSVATAFAAVLPLARPPAVGAQHLLLDRPLTLRWSYPSEAISSVAPLEGVDAIYLPLVGGEIVSLRKSDGQLIWKTEVGGDVLLTPPSDAERLYVASRAQNGDGLSKEPVFFLRSISRSSGVILWFDTLPGRIQHAYQSLSPPGLVATLDDIALGVEKKSGAVKWSAQLPARIAAPPVFYGNRLYLPLINGELFILKIEDGKPFRRYRTRGQAVSLSLAEDGMIYSATSDGYVSSLTEMEGSLTPVWRKRVGGEIQSMNLAADGLLIVSSDSSVTFIKRQNGKRLWKRRLPDRLATQPVLHEGYALFAPLAEDTCVVLSLRDGRQVNTINLGANNSVVAPPVVADDYLLIPTKTGLLAFAASGRP